MIILKSGAIFYTFGGAAILIGLCFLFPQIIVKKATKEETDEAVKQMKNPRFGIGVILVGVVFIILGIILKF